MRLDVERKVGPDLVELEALVKRWDFKCEEFGLKGSRHRSK